jgi:cytochrome c-type biogenesis protein CcmH/NrfG
VRRDGPLSAVAHEFAYHELPGGAKRLGPLGEASGRDSVQRARVRAELEREIAGSPQHAQALILLANVELAEGRYAEARALAHRALALDPMHEGAHLRLALIALEEGRAREASAVALGAASSSPA